MPLGAIITLIALGVCLVAFVIILAVMGGRPKYIKGKRYTGKFNGLKTTFIIGEGVGLEVSKDQGNLMAKWYSAINNTVRYLFHHRGLFVRDAAKQTKNIIVQLMDEESYNAMGEPHYREHYVHSAACMGMTRCWFWGMQIPTVCIKVKTKKALKDFVDQRGEPVVHELCHACLDDYAADKDDHADPRVWIAAGGSAAIQGLARKALADYSPPIFT